MHITEDTIFTTKYAEVGSTLHKKEVRGENMYYNSNALLMDLSV